MTEKSAQPNTTGTYIQHDDGMELLTTDFRKEFKKPPFACRAKKFVREQYSPQALIPSLQWMPQYIKGGWRENLYGDVFAGLTVGAFLVPQGMSYALIADLPPIYGLYTASFPIIVYALLGTSNQLAVGPVAIVSLLIGHGVGAIVPFQNEDGSPNPEYIQLCIAVSFFAGILNLAMGLLKLGFLTTFLSHPVVSGFTSAAAIIIALGQAKHILGCSLMSSDNSFEVFIDLCKRIPSETHVVSLLIGLGVMVFLYTMSSFPRLKRIPAAMVVLTLGILISWGFKLQEHGVKVAGQIPVGIPAPSFPAIPNGDKFSKLVVLSIVITLLGYIESVAVGLTYASKNNYRIRPDQELVAFGVANLVGSMFNAYPVAGGFGRTAVNANSGAKTPMAGLISGSLMLIVLAGMTGLFTHLPKPVLGGIVIMAVSKLVDFGEPKRLWRTEAWGDLAAFLCTFFTTLLIGVELGLALGVGCSMLVILVQVSIPHIAVLGRVPHSGGYHDLTVIPTALPIPGTLIVRIDADLWFATAHPLKDAILTQVHNYPAWGILALPSAQAEAQQATVSGPRDEGVADVEAGSAQPEPAEKLEVVILDFSGVNLIDSSALHELHEMVKDIKAVPSVREVAMVGAKRQVRRQLLRELKFKTGCETCQELPEREPQDLFQIFRKFDRAGTGVISKSDAELALAEALGHHDDHVDKHVPATEGSESSATVVPGGDDGAGVGTRARWRSSGSPAGPDLEIQVPSETLRHMSQVPEAATVSGVNVAMEGAVKEGEATIGMDEFLAQVQEAEIEHWDGIVKLFSNIQQAVACPVIKGSQHRRASMSYHAS